MHIQTKTNAPWSSSGSAPKRITEHVEEGLDPTAWEFGRHFV